MIKNCQFEPLGDLKLTVVDDFFTCKFQPKLDDLNLPLLGHFFPCTDLLQIWVIRVRVRVRVRFPQICEIRVTVRVRVRVTSK